MNTIELIKDAVLFGGNIPNERLKEVRDFFEDFKQLFCEDCKNTGSVTKQTSMEWTHVSEKLINKNRTMGLDISVYKNIKQVEQTEEDYSFTAFVLEDSWNDRIKKLEVGKEYQGERCDAGVYYSYGSHYRFRNLLCEIVLDKKVTKFHETDLPNDMPFIKLVDFADNEGCLDWETSEILYNEFVEWKDKAVKHMSGEPHFIDRYMDWLNVFENGKEENTVVVFH